jgi:hypothetical protein
MGIRMLLNECDAIERSSEQIYLAGIDDAHFYRVDNIEKARAPIPPDGFPSSYRTPRRSIGKPRTRVSTCCSAVIRTGAKSACPVPFPLRSNRYCPGGWDRAHGGTATCSAIRQSGLAPAKSLPV